MADEFGQTLRTMREGRGETLAQVADATGISPAMLSRIERGERSPSHRTLERLAAYFDTPAEELGGLMVASQLRGRWDEGTRSSLRRWMDVGDEPIPKGTAPSEAMGELPADASAPAPSARPARRPPKRRAEYEERDARELFAPKGLAPELHAQREAPQTGSVMYRESRGLRPAPDSPAPDETEDAVIAAEAALRNARRHLRRQIEQGSEAEQLAALQTLARLAGVPLDALQGIRENGTPELSDHARALLEDLDSD